jgi:hypothetical protein
MFLFSSSPNITSICVIKSGSWIWFSHGFCEHDDSCCEILKVRNFVTVWLAPHSTRLAHTRMDQNDVGIF